MTLHNTLVLLILKAKAYLLRFVPTAKFNLTFKILIKKYSIIIYHQILFSLLTCHFKS